MSQALRLSVFPRQRKTDSANERAQDAGIYEFTFADGSSVKARCK